MGPWSHSVVGFFRRFVSFSGCILNQIICKFRNFVLTVLFHSCAQIVLNFDLCFVAVCQVRVFRHHRQHKLWSTPRCSNFADMAELVRLELELYFSSMEAGGGRGQIVELFLKVNVCLMFRSFIVANVGLFLLGTNIRVRGVAGGCVWL